MAQPRKIILLIDIASEFDRKLLRGIFRYSKENGPWQFYRMPSWYRWDEDGETRILEWARRWEADAIVGRWNSPDAPLLKTLGIPIALQNYTSRSTAYSVITGDYKGTGELAAEFFFKRDFRHYAYFGLKGVVWSDERGEGFESKIGTAGFGVDKLEIEGPENESRRAIAQWLTSLPKPCALFCCDDARALLISEICKLEGLSVPEDITLLGVDNDELFCEISDPPISSIELDVERGGETLGRLLDERITEGSGEPFTVVIRPLGIIERRSTNRHNIEDEYVLKVVNYLEDNMASEITMADILSLAPLSRRSLEIRFKQETGTSIWQYLLSFRIERFSRLLLSSARPLKELAFECGFRDADNISRTFRRYKGCSPQEFRQKYR